ncbi:MAG TPA: hypothetical protein VK858_05405 [Longimicrobiales bacterium]|nr:hypothetical protein [Longimicrobiales bacterium]
MSRPQERCRSHVKGARGVLVAAVALFGTLGSGIRLSAQEAVIQTPPNRGGTTVSMGLPPSWRFSLGGTVGTYRGGDVNQVQFLMNGGVYKDLAAPVMSAFGLLGEAYGGRRGDFEDIGEGWDGGFRMLAYSPAFRLAAGVDYSFGEGEGDFILSVIHPLQRGGIFTNGGSFRVDWLPGRGHTLGFGFHFPVGQRWVGTSRPRHDYVRIPSAELEPAEYEPEAGLRTAAESTAELGRWVNRLTVPFTDQWDGDKDRAMQLFVEEMQAIEARLNADAGPHYEGTRTAIGETRAFHEELDRMFSIAVSGDDLPVGSSTELGREAAQQARTAMLDHVLLPYDRLLGQKRRDDTTLGFGLEAGAAFFEFLTGETAVTRDRLEATVWAFRRYLELVEEIRAHNLESWDEERFVWLPLQLALRPEEHDQQEELNALVERATGDRFREGSRAWYVENEQWQAELSRMILEAEDYHIVWLHDFRGLDANGDPDEMGFKQVTGAYLPALINAVRRYDDTGKIPQYIQIFDQFYYTANKGELWGDLLQNPLSHRLRLPDGWEEWEDSVSSLQSQLRQAVEESELLQAQAALFGDDWLRNVVKVHLNVTQPPDPSFWTAELFPFFMGLPDTPIRDHRKISLYDVSETDPYKGQGIYTGMGVGEHYIGAGWEDRAVLVEGPAVLDLRDNARQLLLNQGFEEHEIPWELHPKPFPPDYQAKVDSALEVMGDVGWVMDTHNEIGYRAKGVTVLKAMLYTLMGPGAVIKAPDSIWGSNVWGSMMLGHALRGGRSLVIAPAIANAPSAGWPQMSRAQEVVARLVVADEILGDEIEPEGGLMKVGLYSTDLDAGNIPGKIGALLETLDTTPWLADLYGFDAPMLESLRATREAILADGFERSYAVDQERVTAKLHMKAHLYYSRSAWEDILSAPGLDAVLRAHFEEMADINLVLSAGRGRDYRLYTDRISPMALDVLGPVLAAPRTGSPHALFLAVGSHNQNSRSLALDGEVAVVLAGWKALAGLPDFITIAGLCTWVESVEELEELFPGYDGLKRRLSRWIRIVV